jgi:hypothetical protein
LADRFRGAPTRQCRRQMIFEAASPTGPVRRDTPDSCQRHPSLGSSSPQPSSRRRRRWPLVIELNIGGGGAGLEASSALQQVPIAFSSCVNQRYQSFATRRVCVVKSPFASFVGSNEFDRVTYVTRNATSTHSQRSRHCSCCRRDTENWACSAPLGTHTICSQIPAPRVLDLLAAGLVSGNSLPPSHQVS